MQYTIRDYMAAEVTTLRAGGPGSGRHKEFDAMKRMANAQGYGIAREKSDGLTYKHPDGHTLNIRQLGDGSVQWKHRAAGAEHNERGTDPGSLSDHLGWVSSGQKEVHAGGPGSGRHPEFGNFRHKATNSTAGGTNYHRFLSPGGTKVTYQQNFDPSTGKVYEDNDLVHDGDVDSAEKFMDEKYGIKN